MCEFDPARRIGFRLGIADHPGVTSAQANYRNLQFGIDAGTAPVWQESGRPGRAVRGYALAVLDTHFYVGTLPSGHIYAMQVGQKVSAGRELMDGWKHVAAVRDAARLRICVNGELRAESPQPPRETLNLTNRRPLRIGLGPHDHFRGRMTDVRLYARALTGVEVGTEAPRSSILGRGRRPDEMPTRKRRRPSPLHSNLERISFFENFL